MNTITSKQYYDNLKDAEKYNKLINDMTNLLMDHTYVDAIAALATTFSFFTAVAVHKNLITKDIAKQSIEEFIHESVEMFEAYCDKLEIDAFN